MIVYLVLIRAGVDLDTLHIRHRHIELEVPEGMTARQLLSAIGENNFNPLESLPPSCGIPWIGCDECPCMDDLPSLGTVTNYDKLLDPNSAYRVSACESADRLAKAGVKMKLLKGV